MGLLDSAFEDPATMGLLATAAGLLQAGGPSRTPVSLGQAVGQAGLLGMQTYGTAKKSLLDQQREQMQMDMLKQQIAQATRKNSLINDMLAQYSGGLGGTSSAASQALEQGAKSGDVGPTVTNAARMDRIQASAPPSAMGRVPMQAIANDLAFNDGKEIGKWIYETGKPNMQVHNGYAVDMNRVNPGFLPGINVSQNGQSTVTSVGPDGNPVVYAPPGAVNTYRAYQEAEARAKAGMQPLPLDYASPNGRPIGGSIAGYLSGAGGGTPAAQPASRGAQGLDLSRLSPDQQAYLQQQDPQAFSNGVASFVQSNAPAGGLQSAAEREAQVGRAKADNEAYGANLKATQEQQRKDTRGYNQITAAIPMARGLLKNATGSGIGAVTDTTLGFFGKSTDSGNAANQLDTLSGWMTANVPRMEGPQSDRDTIMYKQMAAMVGDRTKPVSARMAALDTLEQLQNKYASLNNVQGGASGDWQGQNEKRDWQSFGYQNPQAVVQDARNTIMRNPGAKSEVIRRLESMGITNHGIR